MKLLPALLIAFVPIFASAETHVLCRTSASSGYTFSFDESGQSKEGVKLLNPGGEAELGSPVSKTGPDDFLFSVGELTVRFSTGSWRAEFETPGFPDMEPPTVSTYQCEPDPAYVKGGEGI